jgi:hypothetical protein
MIEPNYSYRAVSGDLAEKSCRTIFAQSTIWGFTVAAESNGSVLVEATDFLLRDALKFQQPCKTANKAVTLLMQHEVQCICSVPKLSSKYRIETTVTFVNRDGKPGNYVNTVTRYPEPLHDAPLFCAIA